MFDPSNLHGHQGNNDDFVLTKDNGDFQLFRSADDLTFIHGQNNDMASYWGGGNQTIYDYGSGTTLRFSELDAAKINVYGFENDPTAKVVFYNPTGVSIVSDGQGNTQIGSVNFIGASTIRPDQVSVVHTLTPPSQGGLIRQKLRSRSVTFSFNHRFHDAANTIGVAGNRPSLTALLLCCRAH